MNIDLQTAVNVLVAFLGLGVGWLAKALAELRKADADLVTHVHELAVLVAGLQQYQADTAAFRADVRAQLQYIVERLDKATDVS